MGRRFRLASFNDYRSQFSLRPLKTFSQLCDDAALCERLSEIYGSVDQVEFYVGLFAEQAGKRQLFGETMTRMVAVDAFSQIFTNPLLSRNVYGVDTFSKVGLDVIEDTGSLQDIVNRNVISGSDFRASFDLP